MRLFVKLFQDIIVFSFIPFVIYLTFYSIYLKFKILKSNGDNKFIYKKYDDKRKSAFVLLPFALLSLIYFCIKL